MSEIKKTMTLHPIQLKYIGIRELHIETFEPPTPEIEMPDLSNNFKITMGCNEYNDGDEVFQVVVNLEIGEKSKKDAKLPYYLKITLAGMFYVEEKSRNKEKVDFFVSSNSMFILHPFLREHVYALSSRCGIKPVVLPLVTLPTVPIKLKDKETINK